MSLANERPFSLGKCTDVFQVYWIRNAQVKTINNPQYSRGKQYEMTLRGDTLIKECFDDVPVPQVNYNFVPIDRMQDAVPETTVGKTIERA